jgi:hypothetical protein
MATIDKLDLANPKEIRGLIKNYKKYDAYLTCDTADGSAWVSVGKDSLVVKTLLNGKPDRFQCVEYDKNGFQCGVWYETDCLHGTSHC